VRDAAIAAAGSHSKSWRVASCVALSGSSFVLCLYTAEVEPFVVFRWSDLALNLGLGAMLFVLFAAWAFAGVRTFRRAPRRSSLFTVVLGASLLWTAINLFYLGNVIYGYAWDLHHFHAGTAR
jgi:hypothetical protein